MTTLEELEAIRGELVKTYRSEKQKDYVDMSFNNGVCGCVVILDRYIADYTEPKDDECSRCGLRRGTHPVEKCQTFVEVTTTAASADATIAHTVAGTLAAVEAGIPMARGGSESDEIFKRGFDACREEVLAHLKALRMEI